MAYFKINNHDYSSCVNKLKVATDHIYKAQTNAAGNTIVKYVNSKRVLQVGIIPLNQDTMAQLLADINRFKVVISFLNPETKELEENIACIIPDNSIEYYTIQAANNISYKALTLEFQEL